MASKTKSTPGAKHPLVEARAVSQKASARLAKEISHITPWEDYSHLCGIEEFEDIKLVAMFDLWSRAHHAEVLGAVGINKTRAIELRKSALYSLLRADLKNAMLTASSPRTDEKWIKRGSKDGWKRIWSEAAFGDDKERAIAASRDFIDRSSPKATRADAGTEKVILVPESLVELLGKTLGEVKRLKGEVIDVEVEVVDGDKS